MYDECMHHEVVCSIMVVSIHFITLIKTQSDNAAATLLTTAIFYQTPCVQLYDRHILKASKLRFKIVPSIVLRFILAIFVAYRKWVYLAIVGSMNILTVPTAMYSCSSFLFQIEVLTACDCERRLRLRFGLKVARERP